MLAETVREWTEPWVERGIEKARDEERALLCRQAARKFEAPAGEQLAVALADVTDLDRLVQVGEWIIECGTAVELFARLADTPRRGQRPLQGNASASLPALEELRTMLADNPQQWTEQWVEHGIEQGRAEERALLCRQAACKFEAPAGEQLAVALADVTDLDRLVQVGEWIIECGTAVELFTRLADTPRRGQRPLQGNASAALPTLEKLRTMLVENPQQWTEQWVEHGIEQGRAEARALLCRQAARKFEAAAGEQLAAALADVTDPDRLAQVGEWIIECGTAAELFARLAKAPPRGN